PNPIDLSAYKFTIRDIASPRLVWLRSFHSVYNPELCPRVLSLLTADFPQATLSMGGPDKKDSSLDATQREVRRLKLDDRVAFSGKIAKKAVAEWLQQGDIFLNTTNIDNTPVTILEAMACGLCIVSTDVGGIPYLLESEKTALLVPKDDPKAM